jgi:hypothetical protein
MIVMPVLGTLRLHQRYAMIVIVDEGDKTLVREHLTEGLSSAVGIFIE